MELTIKSDEELLRALRGRGSLLAGAEMRWRVNPHHPKSHRLYEQIKVNIELNLFDQAIVQYVWPRRVEMLTSPNSALRKIVEGFKGMTGSLDDTLTYLKVEEQLLREKLETIELKPVDEED